ncbi:MAG TPA: transcription antitermination factor NusB [Thermoleophilia bacterium]|nr:transcription antitermination factor NusB [Thermoleophilia bacterium]
MPTQRPNRRARRRAPASVAPARAAAFAALLRESRGEGPFDLAAAAAAQFGGLDGRDRALAYELVVGTIKRRNTIDRVLAEFTGARPRRTPPDVRESLRLGAYQLLFLDRVPAHAVVSDAVDLVKPRSRQSAAFVNAVLRRVAAEGRAAAERLGEGDSPVALALRWSYPEWLVSLWLRELGRDQTVALLRAGDEPAERCVRVNRRRATLARAQASLAAGGIDASPPEQNAAVDTPDALLLSGGPVEGATAFREGLVTPQSRGSQLVARIAAAGRPSGSRLADLCAAPGGKTSYLAELLPGWAIVAVDDDPARVDELRAYLRRLGADGAEVVGTDVRAFASDPVRASSFDVVLLDAPCTGLGTLASRPDLRWRRRAADVPRLAAVQAELLEAAGRLVAPGGVLVYSVCTITRAETLGVVEGFLGTSGDLSGAQAWQVDDLGGEYTAYRHADNGAFLQTLPSRDRTTGFFVGRLRRTV